MAETGGEAPRLETMLAGLDRLRMAGLITDATYHQRWEGLVARYGGGGAIAPTEPNPSAAPFPAAVAAPPAFETSPASAATPATAPPASPGPGGSGPAAPAPAPPALPPPATALPTTLSSADAHDGPFSGWRVDAGPPAGPAPTPPPAAAAAPQLTQPAAPPPVLPPAAAPPAVPPQSVASAGGWSVRAPAATPARTEALGSATPAASATPGWGVRAPSGRATAMAAAAAAPPVAAALHPLIPPPAPPAPRWSEQVEPAAEEVRAAPPDHGPGHPPAAVPPSRTSRQPAAVPPSRTSRQPAAVAAVLVVAVLVGAVVGVPRLLHHDTPAPTSLAAQPRGSGGIQAIVPLAKDFASGHRGLPFTRDVPVTFLDDAAFEKKFLEGAPTQSIDRQAVTDEERVLKAMHLIDPSLDLVGLVHDSGAAGVEGFYDVNQKALFVRGTADTPYVREVLVHELTHALQDQHFALDRALPPSRSAESRRAFTALAEGDASRIQHDFRATESAADQAQAQSADSGTPTEQAAAAKIPVVFRELSRFPYTAGEVFDRALVSDGGQAELDQAFQSPPTTSAQILDSSRYIHGGGYGKVALPALPAVEPFGGGVWGALGYQVVFDTLVQQGKLSAGAAGAAAREWGGDLWVAWTQGPRSCWRDSVSPAAGGATADLIAGLTAYVASAPKAITADTPLVGAGPWQITACTS